jgi:hypothetical protein
MYKQKETELLVDDRCLDLFYEQLFILAMNPDLRKAMEKELSHSSKKFLRKMLGGIETESK